MLPHSTIIGLCYKNIFSNFEPLSAVDHIIQCVAAGYGILHLRVSSKIRQIYVAGLY